MALVPLSEFVGGQDGAYLLTAGDSLVPKAALDAGRRYAELKAQGNAGHAALEAIETNCRTLVAGLMDGATVDDIAFLPSSSDGVNAVFSLIDWQPGDNVVIPVDAVEFPSTIMPALRREAAGVEVRRVEQTDWQLPPASIAAQVNERTRLVFLSHVSYRTGLRVDLEAIGEAVRAGNPDTILAVDATQSLGVVPVPAHAVDFLTASTCKWLLGQHGIAVFYWNRQRQPNVEPFNVGWYSVVDDLQFPYELKPDANRFLLGAPSLPGLCAIEPGLQLLTRVGLDAIGKHAEKLTTAAFAGARELELDIITPNDSAARAGIVAWLDDAPADTRATLAGQGVYLSGSSGRMRAAFHLYNSLDDVERMLATLRTLQP